MLSDPLLVAAANPGRAAGHVAVVDNHGSTCSARTRINPFAACGVDSTGANQRDVVHGCRQVDANITCACDRY